MSPSVPLGRRPPAIVVGLDSIPGIQTARLLARRGVRVIGIAVEVGHFACRTRACERVLIADPERAELIDAVEGLAEGRDRGVLFPCTDAAVHELSRHRRRLEQGHVLCLPDHRTVEMLLDKAAFLEHATRAALPIPRTALIRDGQDALRAAKALRFPCVLKPSVKTAAWLRNTRVKAYKLVDEAELLDACDRVAPSADVLVAQEWIEGEDSDLYSCSAYFDRSGRPLASFVYRKLRQWPPETGNGTLVVECRSDVVLRETLRLFEGLGLYGLGDLEMKRDARTGEYLITEPNVGRPAGPSPIAEAGGVELLYTAYCDAAGLPLPANRQQRDGGAKWVFLRNDLRAALAQRRRGKLSLRGWLRSLRGLKAYALFSITDPLPFLFDLLHAAGNLPRRRRSRLVTSRRTRRRPPQAPAAR